MTSLAFVEDRTVTQFSYNVKLGIKEITETVLPRSDLLLSTFIYYDLLMIPPLRRKIVLIFSMVKVFIFIIHSTIMNTITFVPCLFNSITVAYLLN